MLTIFWFLFVALALTTSIVWLLDNNGIVLINWLGFEVRTDIFTAILVAIFFSLMIFAVSYILARIASIKFPNLLRVLFKKTYSQRLEKILLRHNKAFDLMAQLMLSLEVGDKESSKKLQEKVQKLTKRSPLNNFFLAKISFQDGQFDKSAETFAKFGENKHAKILVLKSKLDLALQNGDEVAAIAYAKQILTDKSNNLGAAKILFSLFKKSGMWQEAKSLIKEYGQDYFKDELQSHDLAVMNSALASESYREKKFVSAIKYSNLALKAESNFLPAIEIKLKSWLKLGFVFKVRWQTKSLWRDNPHLIFAEIFDLTYRKSDNKNRIKAIKKFAEVNKDNSLGKLAIGLVSFRVGNYELAKEFLNAAIAQEKTYRAYKILAFVHKASGNEEEANKHFKKAELMSKDDHYTCNSCGHLSSRWAVKCSSCNSYDSLEWSY